MSPREWKSGDLLELSAYFWKTCTLHAAVKLDVFSKIGGEIEKIGKEGNWQAILDLQKRLLDEYRIIEG